MSEKTHKDEQEHVTIARALQKYIIKARLERKQFPIKFPALNPRPSSTQQSPAPTSKILPLICPKTAPHNRPVAAVNPVFQKIIKTTQSHPVIKVANESYSSLMDSLMVRPHKFPAAGAAPYIPVRHCNPHQRIAPPVTIRNAIPVFSAPPLPSPQSALVTRTPTLGMAPPVCVRQAVPVFSASPVRMEELSNIHQAVKVEDPRFSRPPAARAEQPPISRVPSGRLEESPFFKLPLVRVEESHGPKLLPVRIAPYSEVPAVQVEQPSSGVPTFQIRSPVSIACCPLASSKVSAKETRIAVQDILQESAEIKNFKELKI